MEVITDNIYNILHNKGIIIMFAEERKIKELQQQIDDLQKIVDSKYDSAHRFYVYKFVKLGYIEMAIIIK